MDNSAYVDSLDILDPDLVKIGKDAVIGEGTTIVPHTIQNGEIRFSEVSHCMPSCLAILQDCQQAHAIALRATGLHTIFTSLYTC